MAVPPIREHFIPLRKSELVEAICQDADLPVEEREPLRQFCRLVATLYHYQFYLLMDRLKNAYAPFDPAADTKALLTVSSADKEEHLNALVREFGNLMERANFKHLSRDDIEPALQKTSEWGLNMEVDFRVFERLAIFARGDTVQKRTRRQVWKGYRKQERQVPIYQRLVMIFKLRPHRRLGAGVETDKVYLQIFKNIPKLDIKMLLPGARVRISRLDRSKIGFSLISGLGMILWRIIQEVVQSFGEIFFSISQPAVLWALATGTLGYGVRSYYGWQQTKQRYALSLAQILYYQNLDTNAGVLFRILDEAEEQECREVILGYYLLWRNGGDKGWTSAQLDGSVELDLERRAHLQVAYEIRDALAKLQDLKLVVKEDDRFRALPLFEALKVMDTACAEVFKCSLPSSVPHREMGTGS